MTRRTLIIALLSVMTAFPAIMAQRRVTPVTPSSNNTPATLIDKANEAKRKQPSEIPPSVIHYHDENGNDIMIDTLTGSEWVDSAALEEASKVKGRIYPRLHALSVGLDIWDPFMRCIGQHYGIGSAWVELSLHNWIKPYVEVGLGAASNTPAASNFTYRSPMAPFFKLGVNYNFLYNSNPDYQLLLGLRYGFTRFSYEITDVALSNDYWHEAVQLKIPSQSSTAGYLEFALSIKVKIWKQLSLGWTLKYHTLLHESQTPRGEAWYIPGYGTRGSTFTGAFSIIYTLPFNSGTSPKPSGSQTADADSDSQ